MAQFDEKVLQSYYDNRNYEGAAKYLAAFPAKNPQAQREVNRKIRRLERDAAIQKSILRQASTDEKEAFSFMQGINGNGVIPRDRTLIYNKGTDDEYTTQETNSYGTDYLSYMNNLKSNDGTTINRIAINIKSDDDLQALSKSLGFDNINANNLGITYRALNNGGHILVLSTDNKNLYKVLNAAKDISTRKVSSILGNISERMLEGAGIGTVLGAPFAGVGAIPGAIVGAGTGLIASVGEEIYRKLENDAKLEICGVDTNGYVYGENEYNYDYVKNAVKTVNKANEVYENLLSKRQKEQTATVETEVSQFLGAGHAEAYEALRRGEIDQTTFDKIQKNWEEYYDRLLTNADFTKKPVYAWSADSGEGVVLKAVDNADVPDLKGEILLALKEGRCSYALATRDGELGTMINIMPKNDKNGEWSKAKGEVQKTIFVEGLFDESANAVFERDTKTIAARQNADMKKYNYELKLANGNIVGYEEGIGSYAKIASKDGQIQTVPISEAEMLHSLNENAIIENSVSEVLANMNEKGELYPQSVNGQMITPSIEDMLQILATAGTNELYPKGSTTDISRAAYQNQLYMKMYQVLNMYLKNYKND